MTLPRTSVTSESSGLLAALDVLPLCVFVFDGGRLRAINSTAIGLMRSSRDPSLAATDFIGQSLETVFPPQVFPGWASRLARDISSPGTWSTELMAVNRDDVRRLFRVAVGTQTGQDVATGDFVVTAEEVTGEHRRDLHLGALERQAEIDLRSSSIAHDLNNLLSVLVGMVEITQMSIEKRDSEKTERGLAKLNSIVERLTAFSDALQAPGESTVARALHGIENIVSDVLAFLSPRPLFANIQTTTRIAADLPRVEVDRDGMCMVLLHLFRNAAEAIAETGRPDGRIDITISSSDERLRLSVTDNGVGIPDEIKARLMRSHISTKAGANGFGVMSSARIVRAHGGELLVESTPGEGSTFTVVLPIGRQRRAQTADA
jgi:signal transduction histidine kinase